MKNQVDKYKNLVGKHLGKCRIKEICGVGQVGIVLHGHHEALERDVAIKILDPSPGVDFFLKQFKKIVSLEHANIISIYDIAFDEELQTHYVIEQWIEGLRLLEVLRERKKFSWIKALEILIEVVSILAYAHQQGVVHGNLVPENLIYTDEKEIKIKDFSLLPHQHREGHVLLGSLEYAAPEQLAGNFPSKATDIYNLGCLFYELIMGVSLFQKKSSDLPANVPDDVVSSFKKMLASDSSNRYLDATELLENLEKLYVHHNKFVCPQCGKENPSDKVFHCPVCHCQNLCFSHLDPEHQCCKSCLDLEHRFTLSVMQNFDKQCEELSKLLKQIANNNKHGVLVLKNQALTLGLVIDSEIEICLEISRNQLEEKFPQEEPQKIVLTYLLKVLEEENFSAEFWENDSPEKILPYHYTRLPVESFHGSFLISFSQILLIHSSVHKGGGISFHLEEKEFILWFSADGVVVEWGGEILEDPEKVIEIFQKIFSQPREISYRIRTLRMPDGFFSFESPIYHFQQSLAKEEDWHSIGEFWPSFSMLLPAATKKNRTFVGIDIPQIKTNLIQNLFSFIQPNQFLERIGLSINTFFILAGMMKACLYDAGERLLESVRLNKEKLGYKNSQLILQQIHELCPQNQDINYFLAEFYLENNQREKAAGWLVCSGDFHWDRENFGLALPDYEKVVEIFPKMLHPKIRLMQLYERLEYREKLREIGTSLFITLRESDSYDEKIMEQICISLLKLDSGLAPCRKELIKIYEKRKDKKAAIEEYRFLVSLYERSKNKYEMAKAIAHILHLGVEQKEHDKLERKLSYMGYHPWESLLDEKKHLRLTRKMEMLLVVACFSIVCLILLIYEWRGWSEMQYLSKKKLAEENIREIKIQTESIALELYFFGLHDESLQLIRDIAYFKKQRKRIHARSQEKVIWEGVEKYVLPLLEKQEWKKAYEEIKAVENILTSKRIKALAQKKLHFCLKKEHLYWKNFLQNFQKNKLAFHKSYKYMSGRLISPKFIEQLQKIARKYKKEIIKDTNALIRSKKWSEAIELCRNSQKKFLEDIDWQKRITILQEKCYQGKWVKLKRKILEEIKKKNWDKAYELCKKNYAQFSDSKIKLELNVLLKRSLDAKWEKILQKINSYLQKRQWYKAHLLAVETQKNMIKGKLYGIVQKLILKCRQEEQREWGSLSSIIRDARQSKNFYQVYTLANEAKDRFIDESVRTQLLRWQKEYKSNAAKIDKQVKALLESAKLLEQNKQYKQAIKIYHEILTHKQIKGTALAEKLKLPIYVQSDPVNADFFADNKYISKTPCLYFYSPQKFPMMQAKRKGFVVMNQEMLRWKNYPYQLTFILKYKHIWKLETGSRIQNALLLQKDMLFFSTSEGKIYAIDKNGYTKWTFSIMKLADISQKLTYSKNMLFIVVRAGTGKYRSYLYALNANTGTLKWKRAFRSEIVTRVCAYKKLIYFATQDSRLWGIHFSGKPKHRLNLRVKCFSPILLKRRLIVATRKKLYGFKRTKKRIQTSWSRRGFFSADPLVTARYFYCYSGKKVYKFNHKGKMIWRSILPSACRKGVVSKKYFYAATKDGRIFCLQTKNGQVFWEKEIWRENLSIMSVVANDLLLANDQRGVFILSYKDGKILWKYQAKGEKFSAQPVYDRHTLFLGTNKGNVYAFWLNND